jgi:hypothetical protein
MSEDRMSSQPDAAFRPAGIGLLVTFLCGCCGKKGTQQGSRMQRVRGLRQRVCQRCVALADAKAAAQ